MPDYVDKEDEEDIVLSTGYIFPKLSTLQLFNLIIDINKELIERYQTEINDAFITKKN